MPRGLGLGLRLGAVALVAASATSRRAVADPITLRLGTPAPKGTAWAHDFETFKEEVEKGTKGAVQIKLYMSGIAGTETEMRERMEKGQIDMVVSGGPVCAAIMPTMRVMYVVGLFQSQDEVTHVLSQLKPTIEAEAHQAGYRLLTDASVGPIVVFSRAPIASMDDLRASHLWSWDLNVPIIQMAAAMGIHLVPGNLTEAASAFDSGKTDGYTTTPSAALAFQWFAQTRYVTNLNIGYLEGCLIAREKSLDALSTADQAVFRAAAASLGVRIDRDSQKMTDNLMGAFRKQGMTLVPLTEKFKAEFYAAARAAREKLGDALVPQAVLGKVMTMLADYHAEH